MRSAGSTKVPAATSISAVEIFAVIFGLFLGLALVKFGNPVILDQIIFYPTSWAEAWADAWPLHWANYLVAGLALMGAILIIACRPRSRMGPWLWILPVLWLVWQHLAAAQSSDHDLTSVTLWQYAGCVACYFLGAFLIGQGRGGCLVLLGIFAAFAFCLVRAVDQKLVEYPSERKFLMESQRVGWTNMPPEELAQMKQSDHGSPPLIIHTNGLDITNPLIMAKLEKGRVSGTLFYPNALAGAVLLLLPAALVMVWQGTRKLRPVTHVAAMGLTIFLGLGGLFWSGSKSGWLIALAVGVFWLCRLKWSPRLKWMMVLALVVGGLAVFGLRFQNYFAKGATSVGARFDYWHAAARITKDHPLFGTGPGTFQRPYALLKRPDAEMARLVHNDYLEQFSDSGVCGGIAYLSWIGLLLWTLGRRLWNTGGWLQFGIFAGLLGWFTQGFIEFSLFVPALAWTAFTLAGCLLYSGNQVDKPRPAQ